jgi:hypothetical protein
MRRGLAGHGGQEVRGSLVGVGIALGLCAAVVGGAEAAAESAGVSSEGAIEYGKITPVLLAAGTQEQADLVTLYWVTFSQQDSVIQAAIRATMLSGPKGKWQTTLYLLDQDGKQIGAARATFENSGTIEGIAMIEEGDLCITIGSVGDPSRVKRFRIALAEAPPDREANAELVRLEWWKSYPQEEGDRAIEVAVVDPDGKPTDAEWTLWRGVEGPGPEQPLSAWQLWPLRPEADGRTWLPVHSVYGPGRVEGHPPGLYRVTAYTKCDRSNIDPTPLGVSGIIDLTQAKEARVTVQLKAGYPLAIKVVGAKASEWSAEPYVTLLRSDGFPITVPRAMTYNEDPSVRFRELEPGTYTLEIGRRDWWYMLHPDSLKVMTVEVKPGVENVVTVPYVESPWRGSVKHAR